MEGTTESVTGQMGQTPYGIPSDSFPPRRWMPDEGTSEYVSQWPSNRALSSLPSTQRQMSEERTPPTTMEREPAPTVYHTARMQREDRRCLEDPLSCPKPRPKERKTLQFANGNSEDDDDVSDVHIIITYFKHKMLINSDTYLCFLFRLYHIQSVN